MATVLIEVDTELDVFLRDNEELVRELLKIKRQKEKLDKKDKEIRQRLLDAMNRHHIKSFETKTASVRYVEDCNYNRINTYKLQKYYPSAYASCVESGYREGYLAFRKK